MPTEQTIEPVTWWTTAADSDTESKVGGDDNGSNYRPTADP